MGYTNYWSLNPRKKKFSGEVIEKVEKIFSAYKESTNEKLVETAGSKKGAVVNSARIQFNGGSDDAYEDFYINLRHRIGSNFCKTNRNLYDRAVKAVLMLLEQEHYIKDWHFDGHCIDSEYSRAKELLEKAGIAHK